MNFKLIKFDYSQLTVKPGLKPDVNNAKPELKPFLHRLLQSAMKAKPVEFTSFSELMSNVKSIMFAPYVSEDDTCGPIVFLDFDEDTIASQHDERLLQMRSDGLCVNGMYHSHSYDPEKGKFKYRYVILFDRSLTISEYYTFCTYSALTYGSDKLHTSPSRRTYGSSTESGVVYSEKPNNIDDLIAHYTSTVQNYRELQRKKESFMLKNVAISAETFNELPHVVEFFECETGNELSIWAEKWSAVFNLDDCGRYMCAFITLLNVSKTFCEDFEDFNASVLAVLKRIYPRYHEKKASLNATKKRKYNYTFVTNLIRAMLGRYHEDRCLMSMYKNPEIVQKHISVERVSKFLNESKGQRLGLFAQAGQGKTFTVIKSLTTAKKSFVFIMPTKAITLNQKNSVLRAAVNELDELTTAIANAGLDVSVYDLLSDTGTKEIGFFHGGNPITKEINDYPYVFCTYDQMSSYFKFNTRIRDFLVIDEAHLVGRYSRISNFKHRTLQRIVNSTDDFNQQLYLTATPFNLPDIFDDTVSFIRLENKKPFVITANKDIRLTNVDKPLYLENLLVETFTRLNIDPNFDKILVFPLCSKENMLLLKENVDYRYSIESEIVTSDNQKVSPAYQHLVFERGSLDSNLIFSTSILNTGVDIHNVFDWIIVLDDTNISTMLQALNRDRSYKTKVAFVMTDRRFRAYEYTAENKKKWTGEYHELPPKEYTLNNWSEAGTLEQKVSRLQSGDRYLTVSGKKLTNDMFLLQDEAFQFYVNSFMTSKLLLNCLKHVNVDCEHIEIEYVPYSASEVESNKIHNDVAFHDTYPLDIIEAEIERLRAKNRKSGSKLKDYLENEREYRKISKLLRSLVNSHLLVEETSHVLAKSFLKAITNYEDATTIGSILRVYEHIHANTPVIVRKAIDKIVDIELDTQLYVNWLRDELKPLITARENSMVSLKQLETVLSDIGYTVEKTKTTVKISKQ